LLSDDEKAPYIAMNNSHKSRSLRDVTKRTKTSSDLKLMSSSTARHESPVVLKEMYDTAVKRARSHGLTRERDDEFAESAHPSKQRKSAGTTPTGTPAAQRKASVGTHAQSPTIYSQKPEVFESQGTEKQVENQILSDMAQTEDRIEPTSNDDVVDDPDIATESIESDEHIYMDDHTLLPEDTDEASVEETPLNSPTPRAPRQRSNFDTQAILSSPFQNIFTHAQSEDCILKPQAKNNTQRSSPPDPHSESDASTTKSLQEFRRSLNEDDDARIAHPNQQPRHLYVSPTPSSTSSTSSSTTSGDPDPPLTADELDLFFQEQNEDGFGDDFIVAALKRTRMRPGLAIQVLEAWSQGKPLPVARGIWAVRDDEDVESGDDIALARLGKLHSIDGWGGVTERLVFLEGLRSR